MTGNQSASLTRKAKKWSATPTIETILTAGTSHFKRLNSSTMRMPDIQKTSCPICVKKSPLFSKKLTYRLEHDTTQNVHWVLEAWMLTSSSAEREKTHDTIEKQSHHSYSQTGGFMLAINRIARIVAIQLDHPIFDSDSRVTTQALSHSTICVRRRTEKWSWCFWITSSTDYTPHTGALSCL